MKRVSSTVSIVLNLKVNGESSKLPLTYENQHLVQIGQVRIPPQTPQVKSVADYFDANKLKAYVDGRSKLVSRKELLDKVESIPLLASLTRAETLYRCLKNAHSTVRFNAKVCVTLAHATTQFEFMFSHDHQQDSTRIKGEGLMDKTILAEVRSHID